MALGTIARAVFGDRPLRRIVVAGLVTTVVPPVAAAVGVVVVDAVKNRSRREREAPRPGTYTTRVEDSTLTLYTSGSELYDDMIDAIDGATDSVLLQTFIWKGDEVGQRFMDACNRAAARGVTVRIMYDGFGNLVVPPSFYRGFSNDVHVKRLPALIRPYWRGLIRYTGVNHSKILVIDDQEAFVGGYNIGSLYARHWRDTHLRVQGPVVWGLRDAAAHMWNVSRKPGPPIEWIEPISWHPEVRVAPNLPVQLTYPVRELYLSAIHRAKDHIYITTPYFIPDQQILEALIGASLRGVDVRVMVPKKSNHVLADFGARGFYHPMLQAGITILLYDAAMIHAKVATIDGEWSTVGTTNLDRLSLSFNYETNVEIRDREFAGLMEKVFAIDTDDSEVLDAEKWRERHLLARIAERAIEPLRPFL